MLRLHTLGGCLLTRDGSRLDSLSGQRKALALLAALAAAGERGVSRDTLLGYLWPESDDEHARTSLKQLVRSLRSRLQAPEVLVGSAELRLNPDLVTADLIDFRAALTSGDHEAAAALYTGPFLDGFFLKGADAFERWVATERAALTQDCARVLERLAERASSNGDPRAAVASWRRLAAADPLNARAVVGLMRALDDAGERATALLHARAYEQLVRGEFDAAPEPAVTALVDSLRHAASTGWTSGVHADSVSARPAAAQAPTATRVEPVTLDGAVGEVSAVSRALVRAVAIYVAAFTVIALLGQAAVVAFGLPDWVFTGALIIAASGLPAILVTAFAQQLPNAAILTAVTASVRPRITWRRTTFAGALAGGAFAMFFAGFVTSRTMSHGELRGQDERPVVGARLDTIS